MDEPTKNEIRTVVREAVRDAMAEKLEITFGIDCRSPDDRQEARKDMEFVRRLRTGTDDVPKNMEFISGLREKARLGGEKLFLIIIGVFGTGALYYLISWAWPEGWDKYFKH